MAKAPENKRSKKVKEQLDDFIEKIIEQNLEDVVGERFGKYSKYIIQDRALPDIRDGLKPVQRRILYGMFKLGMTSDKPYKKSARITGEVMGKYHPHGDSSIYDAMVRMSQDFKMREVLIDMHGNNGSIDGDPAAAMRYTEARLSPISDYLLQDLEKKTVDLVPNFDDEEIEPIVLPAKFPNLLVNGSSGISAGYATEIPPHNLTEVIEACIYRINNKNCSLEELMEIVKGPDFPTGGIIQGKDEIKKAYETGRGKIIVRAKTHFEEIESNQYRIVVDEVPYEVNKADMVRKIDQLRIDKKFEDILEVRDESNREGIRICIDLKKNSKHELALNYLFKNTDLQISYNFNMVAIMNRRPVLVGLTDMLDSYIEHQKEVITNRSNYELQKALKRVHILEGLIKMVSILTEVIETIRASKNKADSKNNIMTKFGFTDLQAEAIVTLQLYKLSSTDVTELQKEFDDLQKQIEFLNKVLSNETQLLKLIKSELTHVKDKFERERITEIEEEIEQIKISEDELVISEQVQVQLTKDGYIKRSSLKSFKSSTVNGMKENDSILFNKEINTKDTLLIFTSLGNYIFLPVYKIEDYKWKDIGTYINNIVSIEQNEKIVECLPISNFNENKIILIGTRLGFVKQVELKEFLVSRYTKTIRAIKLNANDLVIGVDIIENPHEIIMATKNGFFLRYLASEVNLLGTQALGIRGMKIDLNDYVSDIKYIRENNDLLVLTSRGYVKRIKLTDLRLMRRFRQGTRLIKENKSNPHHTVSISRMTQEQYKEDVSVNIMTEIGNYYTTCFNFKYEKTDYGKEFASDKLFNKSLKIKLEESVEKEKIIEIDSIDFIPQIRTKEEKKEEENIFNIFDDVKIDLEPTSTKRKETKEITKKKKLSLFDDLFD